MIDIGFEEITKRFKKIALPEIDLVVGVARGGVVAAALAAHRLGAPLSLMHLHYRNDENQPEQNEPVLVGDFLQPHHGARVLLADDVSVSGKTLAAAAKKIRGCDVKTFVLKGRADYVLFPEIQGCVNWPWSCGRTAPGEKH